MIAEQKSESPSVRGGGFQETLQDTNAAILQPVQTIGNPDKAFATLAARYALMGHSLARTDPTDGPATYYAGRWGLVRELPTLDDARRFLLQIGGVL